MNWELLIIFFIISLIILSVIIFLLFNMVPRPPKKEKNSKKILITNDTDQPININVDSKTSTIFPNNPVQMVFNYGTEIKVPIGTFQIRKNNTKQLIIGSYGLHTDLNATPNTRIVNLTDKEIQLSFTTNEGIRIIIVPPKSRIRGPTIFKGQKWNVVNTEIEMVISSLPKRIIVWNGKELK